MFAQAEAGADAGADAEAGAPGMGNPVMTDATRTAGDGVGPAGIEPTTSTV